MKQEAPTSNACIKWWVVHNYRKSPSVDEELADIFGAFIHDGNPEQKRLVKNFMSLISTVPDDCYPGIDAFIQGMNNKQKTE